MRAALPLLALGLAVFLFVEHRGSHHSALPGYEQSEYEAAPPEEAAAARDAKKGFMTRRQFERFLASELGQKASCRRDASGKWTYICRDAGTGARWGYEVAGTIVLRSAPLR